MRDKTLMGELMEYVGMWTLALVVMWIVLMTG
jgi:hypothetical protein